MAWTVQSNALTAGACTSAVAAANQTDERLANRAALASGLCWLLVQIPIQSHCSGPRARSHPGESGSPPEGAHLCHRPADRARVACSTRNRAGTCCLGALCPGLTCCRVLDPPEQASRVLGAGQGRPLVIFQQQLCPALLQLQYSNPLRPVC
jgi:hypothetical protein